MAYCKKCGAYIPIDETACPACGYDPEEEARQAKEAEEAAKRQEEEKKRPAGHLQLDDPFTDQKNGHVENGRDNDPRKKIFLFFIHV